MEDELTLQNRKWKKEDRRNLISYCTTDVFYTLSVMVLETEFLSKKLQIGFEKNLTH